MRTLEKYEIIEEIGHGGMATVFRARDTRLDRLVALKVLHPHLRASKEARARFRREAQGVARLRHPRVLEIFDYSGEESDESWIAAELLTGPTLRKLVDDGRVLPAEIAACFAIEVARALGHAHEHAIIHRDVKPENILLHQNRELKLTDFGIADMVDQHTMTATGQILGSPGHMAPEQIEGRDTDARTDVFALGTVLYFLACGRLPFSGKNPHQVLKRIVDGEYADPQRVRPEIGGRLRAIIVRALAHDPSERHGSAAELERDLRAFVAESGIDDPEATIEAYLGDPDAVSAELRAQTIAACTARGKAARDAGDVPTALDYFGRVLALDEGNEAVLALVESVGRGQRQRSALAIGAIVVGVVLVAVAGAYGLGGWGATAVLDADDAGVARAIDGGADVADARAQVVDAERVVEDADAGPASDSGEPPSLDGGRRVPGRRPDVTLVESGELRRVVFDMDPRNVSVGVDGAPPRPVGTGFQSIDLAPGVHRFTIENERCCVAETIERRVPPGEGEWVLSHRLESQPALVVFRSAVPADVVLGGGLGRGRTGAGIPVVVAARERRAVVTYTVTAPGYADYTGEVQVEAGQPTQVLVVLERQAGP